MKRGRGEGTLNAAGMGTPDRQQGVASGIVATGSGVGAAVGLAVLVLIANANANANTGGLAGEELRNAAAQGIARSAFAIAGAIVLTLLVVIGSRTDKPAAEAADSLIISNGDHDHAA